MGGFAIRDVRMPLRRRTIALLAGGLVIATQTFAISAGAATIDTTYTPQGPRPITGGQVESVTPNNEVAGAVHAVVAHPADAEYPVDRHGQRRHLAHDQRDRGVADVDAAHRRSRVSRSVPWNSIRRSPPTPGCSPGSGGSARSAVSGAMQRVCCAPRTAGRAGRRSGRPTWPARASPVSRRAGNTMVVASTATRTPSAPVRAASAAAQRRRDLHPTLRQRRARAGRPDGGIYDLVGDRSNNARLYAGGQQGIFRSDDTGATWTNVTNGAALQGTINAARRTTSSSPSTTTVAPTSCTPASSTTASWRASSGPTDQGANWTQLDTPVTNGAA